MLIGERVKEARLKVGNGKHLLVCTLKLTERERLTLRENGADTVITPRTPSPEHLAERITAELILQGVLSPSSFGSLRGATKHMRQLYSDIETLAEFKEPVLILGETGTGKDLIAREIHRCSKRPKPFLKLNCAEFSPELLRSELFGHAKGSFTGAQHAKAGLMAEAGEGTLFLDEIGELDIQVQAMLLQVLEDRIFRAVGANKPQDFNARLVLATHRNLEQMVDEKKFRRDLLARINDFILYPPALHERRADIPLLVHHFIKSFNAEYPDRQVKIPAGALDCLFQAEWPENVRQLLKVVRKAAVFRDLDGNISEVSLQNYVNISNQRKDCEAPNSVSFDSASDTIRDATRRMQKAYLKAVLNQTKGDKEEAIRVSGISRSRFYELIKELEIL
jgi:DNA-binding NtrC family response regulator